MNHAARLALFKEADLYPVTCEALSNGRSNLEVLEGILAGGAKLVQLREKHASKAHIYRQALAFRARTLKSKVLLIINDHLDIALAVGADGVHLGQDDLPVQAARALAPELLIGASTHNEEEALRAISEGADYVNIGPIFATGTKEGAKQFLGPAAIGRISTVLSLPFTVMGGIKMENIDQVLEQGASIVAMVTEITLAPDIAGRVRELREKIGNR